MVAVASVLGVCLGLAGAALARGSGVSADLVVRSAADIVVLDDLPGHEEPDPVDRVLDLVDPTLRLQVDADDGTVLTVGVARADDVDTWLAETTHARGTWVDDAGTLATHTVAGTRGVADGQPEWLDLQSGTTVEVEWGPESREVVVVVLGDRAEDGVAATVGVGLDQRLLVVMGILVAVGASVLVADLWSTTTSLSRGPVEDLVLADADPTVRVP